MVSMQKVMRTESDAKYPVRSIQDISRFPQVQWPRRAPFRSTDAAEDDIFGVDFSVKRFTPGSPIFSRMSREQPAWA
jgi:hypothetical protein